MKRIAVGILFLILVGFPRPLAGLQVDEVRWGFDRHVVSGRINLLSVRVSNPESVPFDGQLTLTRSTGVGGRAGAKHCRRCFLSSNTSRWVRFYAFVPSYAGEYRLSWGLRVSESIVLRVPPEGPPACVALRRSGSLFSGFGDLPTFPDELFPPTVGATDGLSALVMDHAPKWEPARRSAFMDWLRGGGTVHLLLGSDGKHPTFPADMSELNAPMERFRVGAGLLVRHAVRKSGVSRGYLAGRGFIQPKKSERRFGHARGDSFLVSLRGMTRPEHNWLLIYILLFVYIGVIGPVNFLIGKKLRDYRISIVFFLAGVIVFAFLFERVGRRGHGEASAVHTLACARSLNSGFYDVAQWTSVFVTRGDYYTITHDAEGGIYETPQIYEAVNGVILPGKDARFLVDIPLYSSSTFMHRGKMKGPELGIEVLSWKESNKLTELKLKPGPDFPAKTRKMWLAHGEHFYPVRRGAEGTLVVKIRSRKRHSSFFRRGEAFGFSPSYYYGSDEPEPVDDIYNKMVKPLIARCMWVSMPERGFESDNEDVTFKPIANGRAKLFVFADSPPTFHVRQSRFGSETSRVLYHIDLFKETVCLPNKQD